tara:strand:+ start:422 stop:724 length:303 start_codon:yes stop_codon:yes gene_type:complete
MVFLTNSILVAKANENKYLIRGMQEENKLKEFNFQNQINFSHHDRFDNQLKMFFGFDAENPETSFYPDLLIISDTKFVRDMYKLKLNNMTINKINYKIEK